MRAACCLSLRKQVVQGRSPAERSSPVRNPHPHAEYLRNGSALFTALLHLRPLHGSDRPSLKNSANKSWPQSPALPVT